MDASGLHVTIKGDLHKYGTDFFTDISGCVVVEHKEGLIQKERPHYHIWLPEPHTIACTKKSLRSYYDGKASDLKWNTHANAYYSVTDHNSFSKWLQYCIDPEKANIKFPRILLWNRPDDMPRLNMDLIVSDISGADGKASPGSTGPVVAIASARKHQTTQDKQAKFYKYVKEYVKENPEEVLDYTAITDLLYEYSTGGFNEMAAPQYIEFAMYHYLKDAGDAVRAQDVKETWRHRVMSRMRK